MDVLIDGMLTEMLPAQSAIADAVASATGVPAPDVSVHRTGENPPECEWVVTGHLAGAQKIFIAHWHSERTSVKARSVQALCQEIRALAPPTPPGSDGASGPDEESGPDEKPGPAS